MKPFKPLFMKTYGKQIRKVSAWLSPENRKQVFDSSVSTDGDVFEPSNIPLKRQKRTRVCHETNRGRLAKKNAILSLVEQSTSSSSFESTPKRQKRTRMGHETKRVGRLAKRKAMLSLVKQNTSSSSFESTQKRHNCPPKRKAKVYRSPTSPQSTQQKKNTSDHLPSLGRYVTQRRRTVTAKPKNPKVSFNLFNSSDESTLEALGSSRVLKPRRRKVPPAFVPSSAENSEILSEISSFPPNTLKEIPLDVLSDHSFGSRPRKPIFCSTPSSGHFPNRPCVKSMAVSHTTEQWGSSPTVSVTSAGVSNPLQHDLDSLGRPQVHSEEKLRLSFGENATSGDSFVKTKISNMTRSRRERGIENNVTENKMGGGSSSGNLFSSESLESSSQFQPAFGDRANSLVDALKEKCLRVPCTVQLARLYNPTVSQLCSQTTYSSSLEHSRKGYSCRISEPFNLKLSVCSEKSNASVLSVDTQSILSSPSTKPKGQSTSVQRVKTSQDATRDKKRSTSTDRSGTSRKACVSGLSVNRWRSKDSSVLAFKNPNADSRSTRAEDCSISEMIAAKSRKQSQMKEVLGATMNFSTPLRVSRLNLSSLLADFTPSTHTWSRIKAVLSVHRKGIVLQNPSSSWILDTPRRAAMANVSQDLFATPRSAIASRLPSQLLHNSSLVECADGDLSDAEKVYAECGQRCPLPWEECILPQRMKQCVKIGEGTFGEVFTVTNASGETVALKVIPVEGSEQVNGEDQKTFGEILHEIIISKELSHLKEKEQNQSDGFIGLIDLHCVQGRYPPDFMDAWDTFNQKKCSENDRPDFFKKDQIFLILEFEFGGADLENSNGKLASLGVAKSILHQVTAALAVAEQELHFEHRDLHWGNVLVKPTKQKKGSFLLNGTVHSVETRGVLVRIIDYSLSRLEIDDLTVSCDISNDEELFMGQGDYQFDIYRLMRKENGNNWTNYHPHTNVLWLHYLCSKLLSMKYRSAGGKAVKAFKEALTQFSNDVLQYGSATEVLRTCSMFKE